jgi:transposase
MGLSCLWSTEMHAFTPKQRSKLLANPNVQDVTEKTVSFYADFKIRAVYQYLEGISPNQIFEKAEIPLEFFQENYCRLCLKRWVKKFRDEGEESLRTDERGKQSSGRPHKERLEDLTYDELLALVEIQKGALDELRKQKALAKKKY